MTRQEAFDLVARHLLEQGRQSVDEFGVSLTCMYRASDGAKCAIGCLIPDDVYTDAMEDCGKVDHLVREYGDVLPSFFQPMHVEFLEQLRQCHDQSFIWRVEGLGRLENALREFARRWWLVSDVIREIREERLGIG